MFLEYNEPVEQHTKTQRNKYFTIGIRIRPHYKTHTHKQSKLVSRAQEQTWFEFNNNNYKQEEGLAMGAPTLALLAETDPQ
jgi:hypothetical protein